MFFSSSSSFSSLLLLFFLLRFHPSSAVKCLNCHTTEEEGLICEEPCEGDICVLWKHREMSTDLLAQGCISGADLRTTSSSRLEMGCRRNRMDALLCLCRDSPLCNADNANGPGGWTSSAILPMADIDCSSRISASFISRQLVRPPSHSCHSDLCFFTEANISRPPPDDPLGRPDQIDSTISRSCGAQAEFNFDLLLGPLWPGHGLHANACYRLISGRHTVLGCSCSRHDCNREVPYPIDPDQPKAVKCHLSATSTSSSSTHFCRGHFCFTQRVPIRGYGDQWTSGCLSANESAAKSELQVGHRNILGVDQWLCAEDFCNSWIIEAEEAMGGMGPRRTTTTNVPPNIQFGTTRIWASMKMTEGGRAQAKQQMATRQRWRAETRNGGGSGSGIRQKNKLMLALMGFGILGTRTMVVAMGL